MYHFVDGVHDSNVDNIINFLANEEIYFDVCKLTPDNLQTLVSKDKNNGSIQKLFSTHWYKLPDEVKSHLGDNHNFQSRIKKILFILNLKREITIEFNQLDKQKWEKLILNLKAISNALKTIKEEDKTGLLKEWSEEIVSKINQHSKNYVEEIRKRLSKYLNNNPLSNDNLKKSNEMLKELEKDLKELILNEENRKEKEEVLEELKKELIDKTVYMRYHYLYYMDQDLNLFENNNHRIHLERAKKFQNKINNCIEIINSRTTQSSDLYNENQEAKNKLNAQSEKLKKMEEKLNKELEKKKKESILKKAKDKAKRKKDFEKDQLQIKREREFEIQKKEVKNAIVDGNIKKIKDILQNNKALATEESDWFNLGSPSVKGNATDLAISEGKKKSLKVLLEKGVKPLYPEAMLVNLILCFGENRLDICDLLLKKGVKINLALVVKDQGVRNAWAKGIIIDHLLLKIPASQEKIKNIKEAISANLAGFSNRDFIDQNTLNKLKREKLLTLLKIKIGKIVGNFAGLKVATFVGVAAIVYFLWKNHVQFVSVSF